jgi:uncharacterized protein
VGSLGDAQEVALAWAPEIRETHISVVILIGDYAYKLKKDVALGFIDQSTVEKRRVACDEEIDLNRRFAPDVYLGVAEVRGPEGLREPLVMMRRLPDAVRLSTLVTAGSDVRDALHDVVERVAQVHHAAARRPAWNATATAEAVQGRWEAGFEQLHGLGDLGLDHEANTRVEQLVRAYLAGRAPLFEHRIAQGAVRDGHGDLLAEDIFCLPDGPRILDCLEFDEALRVGDVLADIGFLAMDLEHLGHPDLAGALLDDYRSTAGATWPVSLEHHYLAYRAHVRCKVRAIAAAQGAPGAAAEAASFQHLALAHLEQGRVQLVLVGGLPATGKSTLAHALATRRPLTVLRSDVLRKELAGLSSRDRRPSRYGKGLYAPGHTTRTYQTLLDRARLSLGDGESVLLDASWAEGHWRQQARQLAADTAAELVEIRCVCPPALAVARMHGQDRQLGPSDATPQIARRMAAEFDPWPEAHTIDTTQPIMTCLTHAERALREAAAPTVGAARAE